MSSDASTKNVKDQARSVNITAGKIVSQGQEQLELFFEGEEKNHAIDIDRVVDDLSEEIWQKNIFYAGTMAGGTFLERTDYVADIKEKVNDVKRNDCPPLTARSEIANASNV